MIGISARLDQAAYSPVNDPTGRSYFLRPKDFVPDGSRPGVIFSHGSGGSEADAWAGGSTNLKRILGTIAQTYPVIAPGYTNGGDKWGNDAAIAMVADAFANLGTQGCSTTKVILASRSMGQLYNMGWARTNTDKVVAQVSFQGVADLQVFRDSNPTAVDPAYTGGYSDATYGATHNPTVYAPTHVFDATPTRLYYATDDTTVPPSTTTTLAGLIAGAQAISMGTGGHSDTPEGNVDLTDLMDWIDAAVNAG